jgi:hypothetical protein
MSPFVTCYMNFNSCEPDWQTRTTVQGLELGEREHVLYIWITPWGLPRGISYDLQAVDQSLS